MEFKHYSVLRDETIENLNIRPDGIYVDGTLGGAGHSYEIAKRLSDKGRLIGIDQDADAIKAAGERLAEFGDRVTIVRSNYSDMKNVLHSLGIEKVDGIMLDLGVSSFQLDTPKRGFTYRSEDAPLDMRMDDRNALTARDIVNTYSENDLYRIIRDYGEDKGRLIGIDQDADAIKAAGERLAEFGDRVTIVRSNYSDMKNVLHSLGIEKVDGIMLDLGVSSFQLDTPKRGFTYRSEDAPLDMRMDDRNALTARDIVNTYSENDLYRIIRDYGEDKFAKNIAKHIVAARQKQEITTTGELNEIIKAAIPQKVRATGGHPSKRTYQAIRIELNHELDVLRDNLDDMIDLLNPGGRICIITFHSLEDRIVKSNFKKNENPCTCPPSFPVCVCGNKSKGTVITRKPILPSEKELEENSRSKSAKLRVFEKNDL